MKRRHFTRICTSIVLAAGSASTPLMAGNPGVSYQRSSLQNRSSGALKTEQLVTGEPYLFFYPFVTTPCLLIKLDKEISAAKEAGTESWHGGVGRENSIVAYSAICSHKMSHPAKEISFINYRHDPISFFSREEGKSVEKAGLISCCSERSVYDPSQGAKVLSGPAPHPLAAIELEYNDATDELHAIGSYGTDVYDRFFEQFGFRASLEHKISDPKTPAGETVEVQKLVDYTRQTIKC